MGFDPYNCSLNVPKSIRTPTLKMGIRLGVRVHSLTLSSTPGSMRCESWASFLAHTLVSPYLSRKPKAKVVIVSLWKPLPGGR